MTELIHDLPLGSAKRAPRREALIYQGSASTTRVSQAASGISRPVS